VLHTATFGGVVPRRIQGEAGGVEGDQTVEGRRGENRADAVDTSRAVLRGKIVEQTAPLPQASNLSTLALVKATE